MQQEVVRTQILLFPKETIVPLGNTRCFLEKQFKEASFIFCVKVEF